MPNYSVCSRQTQPASRAELVSSHVVDSLHRGRRLDLAAAAGADDNDTKLAKHNDMTRTAVRPWLLHSCHH